MSQEEIRFAEYGQSGDSVSARRTRHAFRYLVLAMLALTVSLWLAENYLRYPKPELLYRMALKLEPDSARAILRNLVPQEGEEIPQDPRLARYLAALAFIEDSKLERERMGIHEEYAVDPRIIERYEQAYQADKRSEFILLSYGCALFLDAQYSKARDLFRDARSVSEPPNALASYLEAAARAALGELPEAYNLVSQANSQENAIVRIPQPLWHPSMPRNGYWYAHMRAEVTDRFLQPMQQLAGSVIKTIQEHDRDWTAPPSGQESPATATATEDNSQSLDALGWLKQIDQMGRRLLVPQKDDTREADLLRAITAIRLQHEAMQTRIKLDPNTPPEVHARLDRLRKAAEMLSAFGATLPARQADHQLVVARPMKLCQETFLLLFAVYALAYLLAKQRHAGRMYWAMAHPRWAQVSVTLLMAGLLVLLFVFTALMRLTFAPTPMLEATTYTWYAVITVVLGLGLAYPNIVLAPAAKVAALHANTASDEDLLRAARRTRRVAYAALLRRYYGIVFGCFVVVFCAWVLGFRIAVGLYPMLEQKLLVTGLQGETQAIIEQVRQLLS